MGKIIDNVVKMEWESTKALYSKGGKTGKTFIFASKDYETRKGIITVFFNCYTAFLWADNAGTPDEDLYNSKELKSWVKANFDEAFPMNYDNYIPIIQYGDTACIQEVLEKYGLEEYKDDILARLNDVKPYSEEKDGMF